MCELGRLAISMVCEISTARGLIASSLSYLFHRSNDGTGWLLRGKYEELYRSGLTKAFLKNRQDNKVYEKMIALPPTHGTAPKTSPSAMFNG